MELEHSFTVPVPVDQAWNVLLDVERVAPCMPGATLDSVDGDEVKGRIKVKLGPISMTYAGTAHFTERDRDPGGRHRCCHGSLRAAQPWRPDRGDRAHLAERDRAPGPVRPGRDGRRQQQADRYLRRQPGRHAGGREWFRPGA